jgi:ceramide glucosyltransferase
MILGLSSVGDLAFLLLASAPVAFLVLALWRVWQFRPADAAALGFRPPLTILKPLCGAEAELYERLRSLCSQPYQDLQIVFGVADPGDAALPVVRRLMAEFPERDIALVVSDAQHGVNRKVSNLINMMPVAKHDVLLLSDSDVRLPDDCLGAFVAPLADTTVGAVTAPYRAIPRHGAASRFGALLINDWFFPATLISEALGPVAFCHGQLSVVRRDSLAAIGGFAALANQLADDFMLGQLIARSGQRVVLSRVVVDVSVDEDFVSLARRELRWARTIRATEPIGHFWSVVTHCLPLTASLLLAFPSSIGAAVLLATAALRVLLHRLVSARLGIAPEAAWVILAREAACCGIWLSGYAGRSIEWRGASFVVAKGGALSRDRHADSPLPAARRLEAEGASQ